MNNLILESLNWYKSQYPIFKLFLQYLQESLGRILLGVDYHSISGRIKEFESYNEKARSGKYINPKKEIFDIVGIRILTYFERDVFQCVEKISNSFEIFPQHSIDKASQLKPDQLGYKSFHLVGELGPAHATIPENNIFREMVFEIQIRTILQHTWAEIEHDRNYKIKGSPIPGHIRRKLFVLSGLLEVADREFEIVANEIELYKNSQAEPPAAVLFLNNELIEDYFEKRFRIRNIDINLTLNSHNYSGGTSFKLLAELKDFGISKQSDLDYLVSDQIIDASRWFSFHLAGILRLAMIYKDPDKYFQKCWNRHWEIVGFNTIRSYLELKIPIQELSEKYKFELSIKYNPPVARENFAEKFDRYYIRWFIGDNLVPHKSSRPYFKTIEMDIDLYYFLLDRNITTKGDLFGLFVPKEKEIDYFCQLDWQAGIYLFIFLNFPGAIEEYATGPGQVRGAAIRKFFTHVFLYPAAWRDMAMYLNIDPEPVPIFVRDSIGSNLADD